MFRSITRRCLALGLIIALGACASVERPRRSPVGMPQAESLAKRALTGQPGESQTMSPPAGSTETGRVKPSIVIGSDRFLATDGAAVPTADLSGLGDVTLNFSDADIREVARSILGDILEENYVIDPAVTGTATIQTSRPIDRAALLPTLESLLRANGAALLRDGALYKVVAAPDGAGDTVPARAGRGLGRSDQGLGVQVVPLRFIAASEMAEILQLFAPEGSILRADTSRNLLIFKGSREDRKALLDAVALFDVDWIAGMSFGLFPLQNANAETLVGDLEKILGEVGNSPIRELIRFVPVARLNAVIAISARSRYLEQARIWIERLDQDIAGATQQIHVYYVQNVRAADLASVLNDIFDSEGASNASPDPAPRLIPAALRPDETETDSEGASIPSPGASADGVEPQRTIAVGGDGDIRIIADDTTNSLLVLATAQHYRMVEQAIRKLDIVPLQVLVEATIAEVTLNDALRYGVQWFFDSGASEATLSDFVDGTVGQAFPGFSFLFRMTKDVRVVLNALSSITDVNIVSSPQLMVLDNQTAELQVGDQVPIATQSAVSVLDPDAPIVNSIEFRDTGVILRVTPRVNAGGLVVMDIEQEVSSVVNTTTSGIDSPTIQQRKINSSVAIQSGETVALGGLISESRELSNAGVPVASEVPVLGALFGRKSDNAVRTELLVLITPRVVANQVDARQVTEELRSRLRAVEPLRQKLR